MEGDHEVRYAYITTDNNMGTVIEDLSVPSQELKLEQ